MVTPLEGPESFGQYLKREREMRKITLEEIAAYTRIKLRALEAIERDDFAALPPLAFARAFIRCYADYLGLNLPDVMLRFDAFIQNRYPELTGEVPLVSKKPMPRQRYLPLAFVIIVALLVALSYWLSRPPTPPGPEPPVPAKENPPPVSPGALPPTADVLAQRPGNTIRTLPPGTTDTRVTAPPSNPPPPPGTLPGASPRLPVVAPPPATVTPPPTPPTLPTPPVRPKPRKPWTSTYYSNLGPPIELANPTNLRAAPQTPPPEPVPPAPQEIQLRVTIKVKENCGIRYILDSEEPHYLVLKPNQTWSLEAVASIKIKVDNPDAIIGVIYNDEPFKYKPLCTPWWLNFPASPSDNHCQ